MVGKNSENKNNFFKKLIIVHSIKTLPLQDIKISYKATDLKTVWYWQKNRESNRTETNQWKT